MNIHEPLVLRKRRFKNQGCRQPKWIAAKIGFQFAESKLGIHTYSKQMVHKAIGNSGGIMLTDNNNQSRHDLVKENSINSTAVPL